MEVIVIVLCFETRHDFASLDIGYLFEMPYIVLLSGERPWPTLNKVDIKFLV